MAIRLSGWLEETFESQLLLGNHWLQQQHENKLAGVKTELDKAWQGLYHDNGSCLDITNSIHPSQHSALQVIETHPLTLTDGHSQVTAHLSPECAQDLSQLQSNSVDLLKDCVLAVRKYTIRYTSYGPPREKLRFIVHNFDWLGWSHEAAQLVESNFLTHLRASEEIGAVLDQLSQTRSREDCRCLLSQTEAETQDTMAGALNDSHEVHSNESGAHAQMSHTQMAFGTQLVHPIRSRADQDEPQFIGMNRLEPILAGSTQREEIRPAAANTAHEKNLKLLALLNKEPKPNAGKYGTKSKDGFVQSAFGKHKTTANSNTNSSPRISRMPSNHHATPSRTDPEDASIGSPRSRRDKRQARHSVSAASPTQTSAKVRGSEKISTTDDTSSIPECPWMKDLVFNSQTLTVPKLQNEILGKAESWLKPQAGVTRCPVGNMPTTLLMTFHRMADEMATLDDDPDTDSDMDEDPSPDSVLEENVPSADFLPQITEGEEPPTSQVSWPSSPEPPPKPPVAHQGLPPDSSFETQMPIVELNDPPKPATSTQRPRRSKVIDISDDEDLDVPMSSPPAAKAPADSDDEMEMETAVPHALGEDSSYQSGQQRMSNALSSPQSPKPEPEPIVQVIETPYIKAKKGRNVAFTDSSRKLAESSSSNSKPSSSTSIIYGTYDEPTSFAPVEPTNQQRGAANPSSPDSRSQQPDHIEQRHRIERDVSMTGTSDVAVVAPMPSKVPTAAQIVAEVGSTPKSAQAPPTGPASTLAASPQPDLTSGQSKRKMGDSPSKNRRHSKRREIKIPSFGDDSPTTIDPMEALRKDREESLRKYREERRPSTGLDRPSRPASTIGIQSDPDAMDIDQVDTGAPKDDMSPRHQSLYESPRPTEASLNSDAVAQSMPKAVTFDAQPTAGPQESAAVNGIQNRQSTQPSKAPPISPATIFETFRAAYPEYTGRMNHFTTLCKQMYALELEDKMVPKWQWDDFIIRNRTDYKDYAMECADSGENPEPYFRFYKDNIRDMVHKKGIIQSKVTLQKALSDLGVELPVPSPSSQPKNTPRKRKPSRQSLPESFNQPKRNTHDRSNGKVSNRPQYSFPASSYHDHHHNTPIRPATGPRPRPPPYSNSPAHPTRPPPKATSNNTRPASHIPNSSTAIESTGDPFRDYVFAMQRSTSWTGSNKVDSTKPWPENLAVRPSIEDAPRRKVDVLNWGDVLGKMG